MHHLPGHLGYRNIGHVSMGRENQWCEVSTCIAEKFNRSKFRAAGLQRVFSADFVVTDNQKHIRPVNAQQSFQFA